MLRDRGTQGSRVLPVWGAGPAVGQVSHERWDRCPMRAGTRARTLVHGWLFPAAEEESSSFYVLLTVTPVVLMVLISCLAAFVFFYNRKR